MVALVGLWLSSILYGKLTIICKEHDLPFSRRLSKLLMAFYFFLLVMYYLESTQGDVSESERWIVILVDLPSALIVNATGATICTMFSLKYFRA